MGTVPTVSRNEEGRYEHEEMGGSVDGAVETTGYRGQKGRAACASCIFPDSFPGSRIRIWFIRHVCYTNMEFTGGANTKHTQILN